MKLPIYKAVLSSEDDEMDFMGFVDNPAHGKAMMFFNKDVKLKFNADRQLVTGVAISTNQPIYRNDPSGEYYMFFGKSETRELGRRYLKKNYGSNVNINHDHKQLVKSARIDEIFYIDNARGIEAPKEFSNQNLQDGSMIITYHIADKREYEMLKESGLNGFSIEVFIDVEKTKFKRANTKTTNKMKENKKSFFEKVRQLLGEEVKSFETATTADGLNLKWDGELTEGETVIYLVGEDEQEILATEGVHLITLEEEQVMLTIGADGVLIAKEVVPEEVGEESIEAIVEMMAKQFSAQAKELKSAKATIKAFEQRFSNIEKQLDGEKPSKSTGSVSVGQILKNKNK